MFRARLREIQPSPPSRLRRPLSLLEIGDKLLGGILVRAEIGKPLGAADRERHSGFIDELSSLRAFGLTIVILNHAWPWKNQILEMGWMLMDSFFVLSGFLIGGILLDSRHRPDYYRSYFVRRALRILPLYYVVITALSIAMMQAMNWGDWRMLEKWGSPAWFFVYLGNFPTAITDSWPRGASGSFTPLWSLQIEEQFYLLFPLLIHRLRTSTLARVLAGLAVTSLAARLGIYLMVPRNELAPYVLLPCRMEGFALGALIALRFRSGPWNIPRRRLAWFAAGAMFLSLTTNVLSGYEHVRPFNRTFGYSLSSVAWALLILWLIVHRGSRGTAFLRFAPFVNLGLVSYALYLFHLPLKYALSTAYESLGWLHLESSHWNTAFVYFGTILLAAASWRWFEKPLLRVRGKLAPVPPAP